MAMGDATPLTAYLEDWLLEKRYAERTKSDHRHSVAVLRGWLEGEDLPATLETVTGRLAGRFKTERLVKTGMDPRTANKLLSGLKSYWTWLERHEHVDSNPGRASRYRSARRRVMSAKGPSMTRRCDGYSTATRIR